MKSVFFLLAAAALFGFEVARAGDLTNAMCLRTNRMYVLVDAGGALQQNVNIRNTSAGGGGQVDFDTGFRGDVVFGYRLCRSCAAEFETGVILSPINSIAGNSLSTFGASGEIYEVPLLVNLVYRVPLRGPLIPYVSVGAGGAVTFLNLQNVPLFGYGGNSSYRASDFTFAYQAAAGFKYAVGRNVELGIAYKFIGTSDHNWSDNNLTLDTNGTMTHTVLATITWSF